MSTVTKIYCDRCKKELKLGHLVIERYRPGSHEGNHEVKDICAACDMLLADFFGGHLVEGIQT